MITSSFVVTVLPAGFGIVEGSYSLVATAGSWLEGNNAASALRDAGAIPPIAAVKVARTRG